MAEEKKEEIAVIEITEEYMKERIYEIRGQRVILDSDLSEIYGYTTKAFNQQVKNNIEKFDEDFMFELTDDEVEDLRSNFLTANLNSKSRYNPHVFTEQGLYMLMIVLKGPLAVKQSKALIRTFKKMKDYIYIGIIAALFLVFFMLHIIQSSRISKLMKRYEAFMEGKDATNLADAIEENFQQMEKLESSYQDAEVKMDKALSGITSTFHKLGIVKYDAFKEMGGNLSFALCLLDDNNNGFILNTMHGRESSYTYIKEIENGTAYSTLGEEEKQALQKAISSDED